MNDLLIEIGCEDLPARFVKPLAQALGDSFAAGLTQRGLAPEAIATFATPRRIAVRLDRVAAQQSEQTVERKGPKLAAALKDGEPTPAGLGFAKTCGVEFSQLAQENGQLVFRATQPGRRTVELIPELFEDALKAMDALVPKRMRWGTGTETFVRPVEWLLALYGDAVIPLERFGLTAGPLTRGHRFHAPAEILLRSPADYEPALKTAKVWADFASRRDEIKRQIEAEAAKLGGTARIDEALLDEVTALVEWPVVISGRIEQRFLELPPEVIVATVETNQRYFTVFDSAGKLLPAFITIANIESKDPTQIVAGNERVVRPRLSDALFFWQQDLKLPLTAFAEKLASATYQQALGSVLDKAQRVGRLAGRIAYLIDPKRDGVWMFNVAALAKADLATKMVYEFPELQGLMGGYYAAKAGEPEAVSKAIAEHYQPTHAGGPIPSTIEGRIVALADKLDTLAGIFAIGQKPTASKDPFALRRAALGVLRILIEGALPLDLAALLDVALQAQPDGKGIKKDAATLAELSDFVFERLRGYYAEQGLPPEMFEAVKALGITTPTDFDARVQALRQFWARPEAKSLAAAHKRVRNILRQSNDAEVAIDPSLFIDDAERALFDSVTECANTVHLETSIGRYGHSLSALATLQRPVDRFFADVMVNAEDIPTRLNRLALLRVLDSLCRSVADISLLPG